jgi:hypothetical protein
VKDLQKGKRKKDGCGAKVVYDVHCPFAEEMKERKQGTIFYRRFHLFAILSHLDCSDNISRKKVLIPHSMIILTSPYNPRTAFSSGGREEPFMKIEEEAMIFTFQKLSGSH